MALLFSSVLHKRANFNRLGTALKKTGLSNHGRRMKVGILKDAESPFAEGDHVRFKDPSRANWGLGTVTFVGSSPDAGATVVEVLFDRNDQTLPPYFQRFFAETVANELVKVEVRSIVPTARKNVTKPKGPDKLKEGA
jgi:hypothetical protein